MKCKIQVTFQESTFSCKRRQDRLFSDMFRLLCFPLQIRVMAEDGGSPRLRDTTVVEVAVTRNLNKPRFNTASYTTRVKETLPLGASIKTVTANDADKRVGLTRCTCVLARIG